MPTHVKTKSDADLLAPDAEANLLSLALIDGAIVDELGLKPSTFGIERHAWIFAAMQRIRAQGAEITLEQVRYQMEANGHLADVGGVSYLASLAARPVPLSAARGDADLVQRMAVKRGLANAATEIAAVAYDSAGFPTADILAAARRKLDLIEAPETLTADPWAAHVRTLADAFAEREPVSYLVEGLFAERTLNILYGAPGTLKSMLLADLCACVASGTPWLAPLPNQPATGFATKSAPVLWLDFDNGRTRTDARFEAIARAHGLDATAPITYYSMPSPWLDASSTKDIDALIARAQAKSAGIIVIDNLGVVAGGVDENAAGMANVMANLRRVAEETGAAVIVIHHQRKSGTFSGRAGDSLRGHSSIEAAIDLALLVERDENADLVTVKATKVRGVDVPGFGALWTFDHKFGSKELQTARFFGAQIEDATSTRAIERAILETVKGNAGIGKTELAKNVHDALPAVGMHRIRSQIGILLATKAIVTSTGAKGIQRVQLPG